MGVSRRYRNLWELHPVIRPTLGPVIFGTKRDRDKQIYSAEKDLRGVQWDQVELYNEQPTGSKNVKKGGQSQGNSIPPSSMITSPHPHMTKA